MLLGKEHQITTCLTRCHTLDLKNGTQLRNSECMSCEHQREMSALTISVGKYSMVSLSQPSAHYTFHVPLGMVLLPKCSSKELNCSYIKPKRNGQEGKATGRSPWAAICRLWFFAAFVQTIRSICLYSLSWMSIGDVGTEKTSIWGLALPFTS